MTRSCRFVFGSRSGVAEWSFDGSYLTVTPEVGSPLSFPVVELAGISGDGYTLAVAVSGGELVLSLLGAEGPTALEELRRKWLVARAQVLRLGGTGEGKPFSGRVAGLGSGTAEPFEALLSEDVLVVAREGKDLEPIFLALLETVEFDDAAYTVGVWQWPAQGVSFSRLAGRTEEFLKSLRANRELLAEEAAGTLAGALPTAPAGSRGALAGMWMSGRLLEIEAMEAVCQGFREAFRDEWLPSLLRRGEGEYLLGWASPGSAWLGCTREPAGENGEGGSSESQLWMLCGKAGTWFLEALSSEDRATYCFGGGEEVPALVSRLLCAPQFSKEALYSPLAELVGANADLAIPAQALGFLVELRERFRDRVIHQTPEGWKKDVERLSKGASR